jgi:hypothetical protein
MASEESVIEKKKWYKTTTAVLGLVSVVVAAIMGLNEVWTLFKPDEQAKVNNNTLIVLDRSAAMAEPFDGVTKFEAAKNTLIRKSLIKIATNDNLALRMFGGPCFEESSSRLVIKFGQDNKKDVEKEFSKIKTEHLKGETTLVSAIVDATGDFNPPERFSDVNTNIVVIAGGFDSCPGASAQDIIDRLAQSKIKLDIQLIGLRIPREKTAPFAEIAQATGGTPFFVNTQEELNLLFDEPKLANVFFAAKQHYDLTEDEKAEPLLQQAAAQGVSEAMLYLGKIYSDSSSVLRDDAKAIDWLNKGATAGNAEAMTLLGVMHFYGQGVAADYKQALDWFAKGAEAGDAEAMFNLAGMYDHGRGVDGEDDAKATEWYRKAAALGHGGAKKRLQELGAQ